MARLFLALRYIVSRPISWISVLGIWITVTSMIVTLAIFSGFLEQISVTFRGTTGDVVITPTEHGLGSRHRPAPNFDEISQVLAGVSGIEAVSPHLLRPVLMRSGTPSDDPEAVEEIDEKNFGQLIGMSLAADSKATRFPEYLRNTSLEPVADLERPFARDRNAPELPVALVGIGLLKQFSLKRGQVIELSTLPDNVQDDTFEPLSARFVIGGAVRTGHFEYDQKGIYVELDAARDFSKAQSDCSEICVKAAAGVDAEALSSEIRRAITNSPLGPAAADVATWEERHERYIEAIRHQRDMLAFLLYFFVLVACFNVLATVTILVSDKVRDIGLLGAMGASPTSILGLFMSAGLIMALGSSLLGSATGSFLAYRINDIHDAIWRVTGVRIFKPDIYIFDRIPVAIETWLIPSVVAITVGFAVVCAAIPAFRASRLDPAKALRQE